MPEQFLRCYSQMLPRLKVVEARALLDALLATNGRHLKDADRNQYLRGLEESAGMQRGVTPPAPKPSRGFLKSAGVNVMQPA